MLSVELQSRIVAACPPAPATLRALCLASRALHRAAAPRLYAELVLASPRQAHLACRTLTASPRLAALVRAFCFTDDAQDARLPPAFWRAVSAALAAMPGLRKLCLFDADLANSWVLAPDAPFQLHEARLHFAWDARLVAFLAAQPALHTLHCIHPSTHDPPRPLPRPSLPALRRFNSSLPAASAILSLAPPLTNLQVTLDDTPNTHILPFLRRLAPTIRALSVLELPDDLAPHAIDTLAALCPELAYLGLVPLPLVARHELFAPLMRLTRLRAAQFDLSQWSPHPDVRAQRALVCEVHVFCPQIRNVVFWVGNTRVRWVWVAEGGMWRSQVDVRQCAPLDLMWAGEF